MAELAAHLPTMLALETHQHKARESLQPLQERCPLLHHPHEALPVVLPQESLQTPNEGKRNFPRTPMAMYMLEERLEGHPKLCSKVFWLQFLPFWLHFTLPFTLVSLQHSHHLLL